MKQFKLLLAFLLCCLVLPGQAQRQFKHPGSLLTMDDLTRIKQHVNAREEPWYGVWETLKNSAAGNMTRDVRPTTDPGGTDGTRQRSTSDAYTAFIDAVEWHVTGDNRYADHAVKMLSAWGNTIKTAKEQLFQFPARQMCVAAEMLRYEDGRFYEGWKEKDLNNFLHVVRDIFYPACKDQAINNTMTSWSSPAAAAVLAAGVLLDDEKIYNEGLEFYLSKKSGIGV